MMCTDPGMTCIYQNDRHELNFTLILVRSAPTDILKNLLIKNEFLNLIRQFLTLPDYLDFFPVLNAKLLKVIFYLENALFP